MNKKHEEAISKIMESEIKPLKDPDNDEAQVTPTAYEVAERVAYRLSDYFATENKLFDRDRFLKACGLGEE